MRKIVIVIALLVGLVGVADRVGVRVADAAIATQLRKSAHLTATPSVDITGFPFLTQAVAGKYGEIDITANDLNRGGVRIAKLSVQLHGVHVPLSDVINGSVKRIPVDRMVGSAVVTYADLGNRSGLVNVSITPDGDHVQVTARLSVLGQSITATAVSSVSLAGDVIVLTARSLKALGQTSPAIINALAGRLDLHIPVGTLPYDLRLTGISVTAGGLELSAESGPVVLETG